MTGSRAIARAMRAAGFTRQWRWRRDRMAWRLDEAESRGLRWCICCGRRLPEGLRINALFCSPSCRERARQKRRARGVPREAGLCRRVIEGEALDWWALEEIRAVGFYLCHGQVIARAPVICPRWPRARR